MTFSLIYPFPLQTWSPPHMQQKLNRLYDIRSRKKPPECDTQPPTPLYPNSAFITNLISMDVISISLRDPMSPFISCVACQNDDAAFWKEDTVFQTAFITGLRLQGAGASYEIHDTSALQTNTHNPISIPPQQIDVRGYSFSGVI